MTQEKYIELYDKYQPWIGRPVEISLNKNGLGENLYRKFLLIDIKNEMPKEENNNDDLSGTSVSVKDLENLQIQKIPLRTFDQAVRLISLCNANTLKLSNNKKNGSIKIDSSISSVEFFIIQINSHFGKNPKEWSKLANKIALHFNSKNTNQKTSSITDKLLLSSLISNQNQPVFNLSKTYSFGQTEEKSQNDNFGTLEINIDELSPINENYEVTLVFDIKH